MLPEPVSTAGTTFKIAMKKVGGEVAAGSVFGMQKKYFHICLVLRK